MTRFTGIVFILLSACGAVESPVVLPNDATVAGKSIGDWGAAWWTAQYAAPVETNWIEDLTGERCTEHQSGDVWMLAGTWWGAGAVSRTCTVPADKHLLIPISNYFDDHPCPDATWGPAEGQSLEDFLIADATALMADTESGSVEIDETSIDAMDHFVTSSLVTFTADIGWQALDPCVTGEEQSAVAAGYYVMVEPLSAGAHTVSFTAASESQAATVVDVSYDLTVE